MLPICQLRIFGAYIPDQVPCPARMKEGVDYISIRCSPRWRPRHENNRMRDSHGINISRRRSRPKRRIKTIFAELPPGGHSGGRSCAKIVPDECMQLIGRAALTPQTAGLTAIAEPNLGVSFTCFWQARDNSGGTFVYLSDACFFGGFHRISKLSKPQPRIFFFFSKNDQRQTSARDSTCLESGYSRQGDPITLHLRLLSRDDPPKSPS